MGRKSKKKKRVNKKKKQRKLKKTKKSSKKGARKISRNDSSTSTGCPDLQCIINAATAFKVEKDNVKNFFKQRNRIQSQLKTLGNKLKKKGTFEEDGKSLKKALGDNIENATCGTIKLAKNSSALFSLKVLSNCSEIIKEGCSDLTVNETVTGFCSDTLTEFKDQSKICVSKTG